MIRKVIGTTFLAAAILVPLSASAQGVPGGVERGAREGERAAGPVGAIVGGTIGGVVGGVAGVLGVDQRPRFRSYVVEQHRPSYRYQGDVRVGAELPERVSPTMKSRKNTVSASIATQSSTIVPCSLTLVRTASSRWSNKVGRHGNIVEKPLS